MAEIDSPSPQKKRRSCSIIKNNNAQLVYDQASLAYWKTYAENLGKYAKTAQTVKTQDRHNYTLQQKKERHTTQYEGLTV